ncbi:MAG: sel1 repeat family protein [Gammaproteobacteria bacterium]|nr:sel1 repeat family protein [Gammaproteobacteria bacterium]
MKAAYLTLPGLLLALALPSLHAEEDAPLLIEAAPRTCQPLQYGPLLAAELELCIQQAELGHANAQYQLGNYFYDGILTERDYGKALHWFEQASLQGHADAQLRLGLMFARGEGVSVNRSQAYVILKMAAINGSDDAFDASDLLDGQMSNEELQHANDVLSHIFRRYLKHIQAQDADTPFPAR